MVSFGEVQRAQLANPLSSPLRWCPWNLYRTFKACSDVKERVKCEKQRVATAPIPGKIASLVPEFTVEKLPLGTAA